jgi:DNA-directed RNA polymerase specialized sigma24 family protein
MKELGAALGRLDPESRALLDLSVRRGRPDEEIAEVLRVNADDVDRRRRDVLERLAADLELDGRQERDELFATLPDLQPGLWQS